MNEDLIKIQKITTPDVLGMFWLTEEKLKEKPVYFHSIDYLLDGLLTNYLNTQHDKPTTHQKKFFVSTNYGSPFFVSHIDTGTSDIQKELTEIMNVAVPLKHEDHKKIIVIDNSSKKVSSFLEKKFKDFNFIKLS